MRLALEGDEIVVEVSDHGIGIPVEEQGLLGTQPPLAREEGIVQRQPALD